MCSSKSVNKSKRRSFESYNSILHGIHVINTILDNARDTLYFKDRESRFLLASKAQAIGFGLDDPRDLIGKSDFDFFPPEHSKEAFEDEKKIMETGKPIIGKVERLLWPTGKVTWVTVCKYPLYDLDDNIIGTWGNSTDITELKLAKEELEIVNAKLTEANRILEILSAVDSLSGLYNHRLYFEEAQKVYRDIADDPEKFFSIILIDIDKFKHINDTYGHLCGDYTIKHVASLISSTLGKADKAFRYGGDEFIALLPATDKGDAAALAEKLRTTLNSNPVLYNGIEIFISISAGVAASCEAANSNDLLVLADKRLYHSKESGRNKVTAH